MLQQLIEMSHLQQILSGEVAEWSNVPDSKSGVPRGTGGSNPSLSAKKIMQIESKKHLFCRQHHETKYQRSRQL